MLKLFSLNKSKFHNYYCIEKKQEFFQIFREILKKMNFDWYNVESFGRPLDDDGEFIQYEEDNISDYIDKRFSIENEVYTIEVIFGVDKIHVIVQSFDNRQEETTQILNQYFAS